MTEVAISVQVYEKKDQYIVNSEVLSWHNFLGTWGFAHWNFLKFYTCVGGRAVDVYGPMIRFIDFCCAIYVLKTKLFCNCWKQIVF